MASLALLVLALQLSGLPFITSLAAHFSTSRLRALDEDSVEFAIQATWCSRELLESLELLASTGDNGLHGIIQSQCYLWDEFVLQVFRFSLQDPLKRMPLFFTAHCAEEYVELGRLSAEEASVVRSFVAEVISAETVDSVVVAQLILGSKDPKGMSTNFPSYRRIAWPSVFDAWGPFNGGALFSNVNNLNLLLKSTPTGDRTAHLSLLLTTLLSYAFYQLRCTPSRLPRFLIAFSYVLRIAYELFPVRKRLIDNCMWKVIDRSIGDFYNRIPPHAGKRVRKLMEISNLWLIGLEKPLIPLTKGMIGRTSIEALILWTTLHCMPESMRDERGSTIASEGVSNILKFTKSRADLIVYLQYLSTFPTLGAQGLGLLLGNADEKTLSIISGIQPSLLPDFPPDSLPRRWRLETLRRWVFSFTSSSYSGIIQAQSLKEVESSFRLAVPRILTTMPPRRLPRLNMMSMDGALITMLESALKGSHLYSRHQIFNAKTRLELCFADASNTTLRDLHVIDLIIVLTLHFRSPISVCPAIGRAGEGLKDYASLIPFCITEYLS